MPSSSPVPGRQVAGGQGVTECCSSSSIRICSRVARDFRDPPGESAFVVFVRCLHTWSSVAATAQADPVADQPGGGTSTPKDRP